MAPQPAQVGKANLEQARALLARARRELQPRQWELLDQKLTAAERAWECYDALSRTSGKPAKVPSSPVPVLGFVGAQTATAAEASTVTAAEVSALSPFLLALAAVWPSPIGNDERTPRLDAELSFEDSLREVAAAAEQVEVELELSRGRPETGTTTKRRPECVPIPVAPHRGGDVIHDTCADVVPPNRFPGHDVRVNGKLFDALAVGADVLWELKTYRYDTYPSYLRDRVVEGEWKHLAMERDIARACGYHFVVGVSSAAYREALLQKDRNLDIRLTGC